MTLVLKRNAALPSMLSDFFNSGRLLPSVFDFDGDLIDFEGAGPVVPSANILENGKDFKIEIVAPGLERKDFKVEVDNGILSISAEKEEKETDENVNYRRREFSYNYFSRSFTLPENSVPEKIDAKYEGGILRISIPKKEVTISKPVKEIKVS
jgi:HSP20 family protein